MSDWFHKSYSLCVHIEFNRLKNLFFLRLCDNWLVMIDEIFVNYSHYTRVGSEINAEPE